MPGRSLPVDDCNGYLDDCKLDREDLQLCRRLQDLTRQRSEPCCLRSWTCCRILNRKLEPRPCAPAAASLLTP